MKLLIWDFDGTLAFREGMWSSALVDVARAHVPGSQATREDFAPHLKSGFFWHVPEQSHEHIGSPEEWWNLISPVLVRALTAVTGITPTRADGLMPVVRSTFVNPRHWSLFEDVLPCLQTLSSQGWNHVVLSNHVPELPELVQALGLTPHIAKVFNSATLGYEKPHAKAFAAVREAFPSASTAWMIGDNYNADILGAEAAGLKAILVRRPNPAAIAYHESLTSIPAALTEA